MTLDAFFFERGVGATTSSGTGSCACAAAAMATGRAASPVKVHAAGRRSDRTSGGWRNISARSGAVDLSRGFLSYLSASGHGIHSHMSISNPQPVKPPALRPGDTVGIVAPASNIRQADLEAGCDALRHAGYKPFYLDSILERDLYFAGSDRTPRTGIGSHVQARRRPRNPLRPRRLWLKLSAERT